MPSSPFKPLAVPKPVRLPGVKERAATPFNRFSFPVSAPVAPVTAAATGYQPFPQQIAGEASGGTQFDYKSFLSSLLKPFQLQAAGESAADAAALRAAQQRAVIQYGEVPPGLTGAEGAMLGPSFASNIDDATRQLASSNTQAGLSTEARLEQAHRDAQRAIKNALAARGLIRSGETGYQLGREQTNYARAQYDARQAFLDYLSGLYSGFVQAERQRKWAEMQRALSVAQMVPLGYGGGGGGGGGGGQAPTASDGSYILNYAPYDPTLAHPATYHRFGGRLVRTPTGLAE